MRASPPAANGRFEALLGQTAPAIFVVLWASGFIVARLVRPFVEPEGFISIRFALSAAVLALIALAARAPWPRTPVDWLNSLIAGALMQGVYIGGTFWAIKHGVPAAVAALISGLQPLLTGALAGPLLRERVGAARWCGIAVGFVGALLVLAPTLRGTAAIPAPAMAVAFVAMCGITFGTIWQKRIGAVTDLRSGAAIQFLGGAAVTLPFAATVRGPALVNVADVWIGLAWAVIVLSVVATLLLLHLIRGGAVARVTSLFYLVPPFTALMALALFGEALVPLQIAGMMVAAAGVVIANRRQTPAPRPG